MKKLTLLLGLALVLATSCSYKKKGKIVMDVEGKFYKLVHPGAFNATESYRLIPIDTNVIKPVGFCK